MKVYYPPWHGKEVIREWTEKFTSGTAKGSRDMIECFDKKGKKQTYTKWVKWL